MKLRNVLVICGLLGLVTVFLLNGHEFNSFWHLLKSLRWYILALVVVVQVASYYLNALYYHSILKLFSYKVGIEKLFEGALATNFVNYILPSVGLAGAGFLSQVLSPEVPRGEGVLTQLMRYALSALAVLVMMPVGFAFIIFSGLAGHPIVKATLLSAIAIMVLAFIILALFQHESALRRSAKWLERHIHHLIPKFKGISIDHFIDEFYVGYRAMTRHKRRMLVPFGWSMLYIIVEILTFYLAFIAFGKNINPGIVIMAYLFANIASIFGGVFFSTGIFELGMIGTLVALGLPFTLAFSVVTVYRVLNLLIGLPPGFFFYRKYLTITKV